MGVVVHHEKAGIDDALAGHRYVVEHVGGLFDPSRGVDVAAELRSDSLEIFKKRLAREILRPVEAHMLEEMGETVLVRGLLNRPDIGREVELGSLCGLVVVPDVVGQPVVKLSHPDFRVIRKLLKVLSERGRRGEKQREAN